MKFSELEDQAIRKIAQIEDRVEKNNFPIFQDKNRKDTRSMITKFKDLGHLDESPTLNFALSQVSQLEEKIRKAKAQNLAGKDLKELKERGLKQLVSQIEQQKKATLLKLLEKSEQAKRDFEESEKQLSNIHRENLKLSKLQLQYSHIPEDQILTKISHMEKSGKYDPLELLVAGSKSEKLFKRSEELREKIPEFFSQSGKETIDQIEELTDLQPGQISYSYNGSAKQKLNVADLLEEKNLSPTIEDIKI